MVNKQKEVIRASKTEVRTGLANELGYVEWLNSMKGKPELLDYAVVFFNLRKFSDVNRKYGIENGNRILAAFGNVMLSKIGRDEILGRQCGDQFVAIVRNENLNSLLDTLKEVTVSFDDVIADIRMQCGAKRCSILLTDFEKRKYSLRSDNKTIGYIWAGNFDPKKTLLIKETLSLTTFILSSEIANEQNIRKMKVMSSTDLLTGVLNRNSMNNRISEDVTGIRTIFKPFGIFFIDVNGLKTINDTKGHLAGGVRKAMQKADARMYKHKAEYYARHPEYEWHGKPV